MMRSRSTSPASSAPCTSTATAPSASSQRPLGLHRNTVGNYLAGNAAIPAALERMLVALDLEPGEVLSLRRRSRTVAGLSIADLVDILHHLVPEAAYVLFGSRARGTAKPYSDYDVGVFLRETLAFDAYSRLIDRVEEWNAANGHCPARGPDPCPRGLPARRRPGSRLPGRLNGRLVRTPAQGRLAAA